MDLDDVLIFAAGVFAFVGVHSGLARLRQRGPELTILSLLCGVLLVSAVSHVAATRTHGVLLARIELCAVLLAFALVTQLALEYGRIAARRAWVTGPYGVLATAAVLATGGDPKAPLLAAPLFLGAAGTALLVFVFARAYRAGRREAFVVIVGATILLTTALNDTGFVAGVLPTSPIVIVGFVPFVFALSAMLLARFWGVAEELSRSTKALRSRTRELRKSYGDLRATQQELVRKEQLAVVGELAAVIAHEVRNPLAVVSNAVAGLKKEELSRDDHATLLLILDEEVGRLNRLVTDLLGYARPVSIHRTQLAVDELLERALGLARTKPGLTVSVEKEVETARIWGDASHLRQVFDNLIDNAVQAMQSEGTLTVRLRAETTNEVEGLAIDIVDTGEGMDTMVRIRAKDPFFTTRPSGTGLGLAIVDRILDAHGGALLIASRRGGGTTATVFLPYGRGSEPPAPSTRSPKRDAPAQGA